MNRLFILTPILLIGIGYFLFNYGVISAPQVSEPPNKIVEAPKKIFNAETFTLDNGLEVVVIPNHRAPVVTHMVWYRVGAADEVAGKSGIAHFLEHLLFKGSDGMAPGEFSKIIRGLGGNDNAFTSQDYTAYYQSIAVEHLETVMTMEAGRMRGLAPPLAEVLSERKVILEERNQRIDNNPHAKFLEQLSTALYINHPYSTPIIGWSHEIEKLSWEDAKSFYDHWYAPNNAILIVSGDVNGQEVYELAQKTYGSLTPSDKPFIRTRTTSPPLKAQSKITMHHPEIRQPSIQRIYRVPSAHQNREESLALEILNDVLGNGPTSRLYKSLVVEQKIATSAGISYRGDAWDDGSITLYATPSPDHSPEEVENALLDELRVFIKNGVSDEELRTSKTRMQDTAIYARDSLSGPAMIFGRALVTGSSIDDIEYWPSAIENVSGETIRNVAAQYLNPDDVYRNPPVTGYLLPIEEQSTEQTGEQK